MSLHHNVTVDGAPEHVQFYTSGRIDLLAVFFYALLAIVMHAFIQEFILDVRIFQFVHHSFIIYFYFVNSES